jgi:hypothetical protein
VMLFASAHTLPVIAASRPKINIARFILFSFFDCY